MNTHYRFSYDAGRERVTVKVLDSENGSYEEITREPLERPLHLRGKVYPVEGWLALVNECDGAVVGSYEVCRAVGLDFHLLDATEKRDFIAALINRIELMGIMFFDSPDDVKTLINNYLP